MPHDTLLTLRCKIAPCRRPFARVSDGVLIVESMHRGSRHLNEIAVVTLIALPSFVDVLRCSHDGCRLPWARIQNGELVIVSLHRSEKHRSHVALAALAVMVGLER